MTDCERRGRERPSPHRHTRKNATSANQLPRLCSLRLSAAAALFHQGALCWVTCHAVGAWCAPPTGWNSSVPHHAGSATVSITIRLSVVAWLARYRLPVVSGPGSWRSALAWLRPQLLTAPCPCLAPPCRQPVVVVLLPKGLCPCARSLCIRRFRTPSAWVHQLLCRTGAAPINSNAARKARGA